MYNEILKPETQTSKIGNFTSLSVGSGSSIFKSYKGWLWGGSSNASSAPFRVNLSTGALVATNATITGAITATSGTFTGLIYATGGDISGNMTVSGSLYSDSSGIRTKIASGKISFLNGTTERAYIATASSSNGLELSTTPSTGKIYFKHGTSNIAEMWASDKSLQFSSDSYIKWSSGRKITATSSAIEIDGDSVPSSNHGNDSGSSSKEWHNVRGQYILASSYFSCQGDAGIDSGSKNFVTTMRYDSGAIEYKTRSYTFKGGIMTNVGGESGWIRT